MAVAHAQLQAIRREVEVLVARRREWELSRNDHMTLLSGARSPGEHLALTQVVRDCVAAMRDMTVAINAADERMEHAQRALAALVRRMCQ